MNENTPIYRYLDLESYLYVLQQRRLPISKIVSWPDSFEGTKYDFLGKARNIESIQKERIHASCWTLQKEESKLYTSERAFKQAQMEIDGHGSAAMWSAYCPRGGVRLKTSIGKVVDAIGCCAELKLVLHDAVYYEAALDWSETIKKKNMLEMLLHKRVSFRHESEYRFICEGQEGGKDRCFVPIDDFFDFFDEVLVSPSTSSTRWISRTIYNLSVDSSIRLPDRTTVNMKNGSQYCRISQLYDLVSETVGQLSTD